MKKPFVNIFYILCFVVGLVLSCLDISLIGLISIVVATDMLLWLLLCAIEYIMGK
jgi:hypothetical protein